MKEEFLKRYKENYDRLKNRDINDDQWRDISLLLLQEIMDDWVEFDTKVEIPPYVP